MECSLTKETHSTRSPQRLRLRISKASYGEWSTSVYEFFMPQMHTLYTIFVLYSTLSLSSVSVRELRNTQGNLRYLFSLHYYQRLIPDVKEILPRNIPRKQINPLKPELNPICYLLALLAHHFLHVRRIRVTS